jgi:hypothetical protein
MAKLALFPFFFNLERTEISLIVLKAGKSNYMVSVSGTCIAALSHGGRWKGNMAQ